MVHGLDERIAVSDENASKLTTEYGKAFISGNENGTASTKRVEENVVISPIIKSVNAAGKNEPAGKKGGKKAVKKKHRAGGDRASKVTPVRDVSVNGDGTSSNIPDENKVDEVVMKAKSHAQALHAVKRAVLEIQLFLLDGVRTNVQLESCSALLTQSEYQDVVVERSIDKRCGYPLCEKPLVPESKRKGRFRISVSEHKIYDTRETGLFCSQTCLMTSKTFALSLQVDRDALIQQDKLAAIVRSVRDLKVAGASKVGKKSVDQPSDRSKDSILAEVKERLDVGIASFEDAGPSDAIEGYTPVTSIRDWRLRRNVQQQASVSVAGVLGNPESAVRDSGNVTTTNDGRPSLVKSSPSNDLSPSKGKSALTLHTGNLSGSLQDAPILKSILKKCQSESPVKRSVSWGDQKAKGELSHKVEAQVKQKSGSKARRQVKVLPQPSKSAAATSSSASVESGALRTEAESNRTQVESKADQSQITQRLSSAEQVLSTTQKTVVADGKSNPAKSGHVDIQPAQEAPAPKDATACSLPDSSSNCEISTFEAKDSKAPFTDAEAQIAERLASAKDLAAALMEAADATATGDFESSEAVARAGLSILSLDETREESFPANTRSEAASQVEETARLGLKWPPVDPQEEEDEEVSSSKGGWHDTAPKNFKLEISMFGTIWMALEEWISAATIAFIYGKEADCEHDFLSVNGREYSLQVVCEDGLSAEISKAFSTGIARVLPDVVQALRLRIPVSTLEQACGRMLRTMSFVEPLPALGVNHWRMLVMLFLEALSVDQVDSIGVHLSEHSSLFRQLLVGTGTSEAEYDIFRGLLLPAGRLPSVSTLNGG
ncbi:hypothetical protein AXG93_40s1200 [Marchantia polymorpha subsp. ruderalis]|uniref:RNA polymerase II subunit B1 CTD phosphatase RPAP2 homolog n=1 Tax=Marchantia polymorpha subsp. ruderalis TaxID=1480154 RepID=A0A176WE06_MARPO|nr:hypothetical protein AXG93_40s1200 [Marchantia polymorpha subsp. ruderalis]